MKWNPAPAVHLQKQRMRSYSCPEGGSNLSPQRYTREDYPRDVQKAVAEEQTRLRVTGKRNEADLTRADEKALGEYWRQKDEQRHEYCKRYGCR
jgi:hypothetical protein